jgi:hypothetical protein
LRGLFEVDSGKSFQGSFCPIGTFQNRLGVSTVLKRDPTCKFMENISFLELTVSSVKTVKAPEKI